MISWIKYEHNTVLGFCILESAYIIYVRRRRAAKKSNIIVTHTYQNIFLPKILMNLWKGSKLN